MCVSEERFKQLMEKVDVQGSPSEITGVMPVEDAKDAPIKQNYKLN
jgi:hypothetical protein